MNIKVSIIVPVYNVARYLRRCLDSCVHQTMREIEIIVVNDCSPDPEDSEIMRDFQSKYPDAVKCVWHSENRRLGGARNTGMLAAKGEYITFIDSDDYIDLRMCEKLYGMAKENNAEYICCDHYIVDSSMRYRKRYTERDEYCGRNLLCDVWTWGWFFKRELLVGNRLVFIENLMPGEDVPMSLLWLVLFNRGEKLSEALYYYCKNSDSIMERIPAKRVRGAFYYEGFSQMRRQCETKLSVDDLLFFDRKSLAWLATYFCFFIEDVCRENLELLKKYIRDEKINVSAVASSIQNDCIREKFCLLWRSINKPFTEEDIKRELLNFDVARAKNVLKGFTRIVVWGSGVRGRRLCSTLREAGISFETTDMNAESCSMGDLEMKPWDILKRHADVVVATPVLGFDEIREKVGDEIPVIDMEEIQA